MGGVYGTLRRRPPPFLRCENTYASRIQPQQDDGIVDTADPCEEHPAGPSRSRSRTPTNSSKQLRGAEADLEDDRHEAVHDLGRGMKRLANTSDPMRGGARSSVPPEQVAECDVSRAMMAFSLHRSSTSTVTRTLPTVEGVRAFRSRLLRWGEDHRRSFPLARDGRPVPVAVAEVLLQRSRGKTVATVYERLFARWPTHRRPCPCPGRLDRRQ